MDILSIIEEGQVLKRNSKKKFNRNNDRRNHSRKDKDSDEEDNDDSKQNSKPKGKGKCFDNPCVNQVTTMTSMKALISQEAIITSPSVKTIRCTLKHLTPLLQVTKA